MNPADMELRERKKDEKEEVLAAVSGAEEQTEANAAMKKSIKSVLMCEFCPS